MIVILSTSALNAPPPPLPIDDLSPIRVDPMGCGKSGDDIPYE